MAKPSTPRIGSLDYYLAEIPEGRELSLVWARALAITGEEKWRKFCTAYDARSRDSQPLEDFCREAKIDPADYLGMFVACSAKYSTLHIETMKIAQLPEVYRKSLEVAQTEKGFDDRTALLKAENLHFAPKASQININQQQLNAGGYEDMASFTRSLEELEQPKQLPAATQEFVDGSIVTSEEKVGVGR